MSVDWDKVEDLAEAGFLADATVISGYDFGAGFRVGYKAAADERNAAKAEALKEVMSEVEDHCRRGHMGADTLAEIQHTVDLMLQEQA